MSGGIFGIWQWLVVGLIVVLLFARPGKISGLMGDFGKGLKNFKDQVKSNKENDEEIEVIAKTKTKPAKKTVKKAVKKKQAVKKK